MGRIILGLDGFWTKALQKGNIRGRITQMPGKRKKIHIGLLFLSGIILLFASCFWMRKNNPAKFPDACSPDDINRAKGPDSYSLSREGYLFGLKIKKAVKNRDLEALFSMVNGELSYGPRRKFIKGKKFSDIFSEEWRKEVLNSPISCTPGWKGFSLGGLIWYIGSGDNLDKNPVIYKINGAKKEVPPGSLPAFWEVDGRVLSPDCFVYVWSSGDNFEIFEEKFSIKSGSGFYWEPGKFFGREITSYDPIETGWPGPDEKTYTLTPYVKKCSVGIKDINLHNRWVSMENSKMSYKIEAKIPLDVCRSLAPNIKGKCLSSYLLETYESMNCDPMFSSSYGIYGVFQLSQNDKKIVVPLKYFNSLNEALNYLDDKAPK